MCAIFQNSVDGWRRRKTRVEAAKKAGGACVAVLCRDAGGMAASGDAPTLDAHLKSLMTYQEGVTPGAIGSFSVRRPTRLGLGILPTKLRELSECGIEIKPEARSEVDKEALRHGLLVLLRTQFSEEGDVVRRLPVGRIRFSGSSSHHKRNPSRDPMKPTNHALEVAARIANVRDVSFEVKLRTWGKWYPVIILGPSPNKENVVDEGLKSTTSTPRSSKVSGRQRAPRFYDVKFHKSSRAERLEETVEGIIRKCAAMVLPFL